MNKTRLAFAYLFFDITGSSAAWILFCKLFYIPSDSITQTLNNENLFFIKSSVIISLYWAIIFFITGFYSISLKRSRLLELFFSLAATILGVFLFSLILLAKNYFNSTAVYLSSLSSLTLYQFLFTYIPRTVITSITAHRVHRGLTGYKTLIIGSGLKAYEVFRKIRDEKILGGNLLTGYVSINGNGNNNHAWDLKYLGKASDIMEIINTHLIEEVIIATEDEEFEELLEIIGKLQCTDVTIKAVPSIKDLLTGRVEHTSIFGTPFLEIPNVTISPTQAIIKQLMDYSLSVIFLIVLLPLILLLALAIRLTDKGPVIFRQERIGKNGRPFIILKFRSMYKDAEKSGPDLSDKNDPRITPVGRFMRKHRLDEIPNLINVLRGEMSFVGPRPERQYYIDQIVKKAPHFMRLLKVKPGITSWGQVKYGYASNVDQMIERLEYDLIYIDNMSLLIDMKILIYTAIIIIQGKGI